MVTTAERSDPLPSPAQRGEAALRVAIAGHAQGAVRRIVLYIVVALALAFALPVWVGIVGVVALLLLAFTDQLM